MRLRGLDGDGETTSRVFSGGVTADLPMHVSAAEIFGLGVSIYQHIWGQVSHSNLTQSHAHTHAHTQTHAHTATVCV